MAFFEINNIKKSFGNNQVLKGIDLTLEKGQVMAIIGASGNGKTTLLRCMNFLTLADEGMQDKTRQLLLRYRVDSVDIATDQDYVKGLISLFKHRA